MTSEMKEKIHIEPPLYLVSARMDCWKCGEEMSVIALIAPHVDGAHGEITSLSNIASLPDDILHYIQKYFPSFASNYSKTAGFEYFANTCSGCGMITGDHFLHSEPDSPFFPMSEEEATALNVEEIPMSQSIEIDSSYGAGTADMILKFGKRITRN
jgi:hypothetical protein